MIQKHFVPITTRRPWTYEEKQLAGTLREKGVPCAKIAETLDRTENAVRIYFGERSIRYKLPDRKAAGPWMDKDQIIREWRQAKDPDAQMLILAELNDVPLSYIQKIIREGT